MIRFEYKKIIMKKQNKSEIFVFMKILLEDENNSFLYTSQNFVKHYKKTSLQKAERSPCTCILVDIHMEVVKTICESIC